MDKRDKGFVVNQFELPILVSKGGNFFVTSFMTRDNAPKANIYIGITKGKPGTRIPLHDHGEVFEVLYIISGAGKITIAGDVMRAMPGSLVYFPAGVEHCFSNDRDEDMVALQIYGPAGCWEERYFDWKRLEQVLPDMSGEDILK
jgi:quercetin dioxygenase-like cupin family protein